MFKCTPEQLPPDLKANLLAMLQCGVNALEGYIRPGCVHLTLHAMLGPDIGAALQGMGVRALVQNLVAASDHTLWSSETLLVRRVCLLSNCHHCKGDLESLHCRSQYATLFSIAAREVFLRRSRNRCQYACCELAAAARKGRVACTLNITLHALNWPLLRCRA